MLEKHLLKDGLIVLPVQFRQMFESGAMLELMPDFGEPLAFQAAVKAYWDAEGRVSGEKVFSSITECSAWQNRSSLWAPRAFCDV